MVSIKDVGMHLFRMAVQNLYIRFVCFAIDKRFCPTYPKIPDGEEVKLPSNDISVLLFIL